MRIVRTGAVGLAGSDVVRRRLDDRGLLGGVLSSLGR